MKKTFTCLSIVAILLISSITVFAHGLSLTLEEPGVLKAEYDGGGFSPRMEVTVFDNDENVLAKGNVDDEGLFKFDKDLPAHHASVDDGMGHNARWESGVVEKQIPKAPVVVGVFALIGGIFFINSKKKSTQ